MGIELADGSHSSRTHPDLPDKPGKNNWVDKTGGLPSYIERIAKHLVADQGFSTSRAIATAVSTIRRWSRGGDDVSAKTQALASRALAEWNRMKSRANNTSNTQVDALDLARPQLTRARRRRMANRGQAMKDGSFPIESREGLRDAVRAYGRASNKAATRRHIIRRAKSLGALRLVPRGWLTGGSS